MSYRYDDLAVIFTTHTDVTVKPPGAKHGDDLDLIRVVGLVHRPYFYAGPDYTIMYNRAACGTRSDAMGNTIHIDDVGDRRRCAKCFR